MWVTKKDATGWYVIYMDQGVPDLGTRYDCDDFADAVAEAAFRNTDHNTDEEE